MNNRILILLYYGFTTLMILKMQAVAFEMHRSSGFQPSTVSRQTRNDGVHLNEHCTVTSTVNDNEEVWNRHTASIRSSLATIAVTWTVVSSCSVPVAVAAGSLDKPTAVPITPSTTMLTSAPSTSPESSSAAGNIVLGGWIGISAYAGIKGVWDKYQEFQEKEETES
mmetsp:Transcript_22360/g.53208  ORF Transcript_22360/g.53208 Transcript_22360/m.53208 type:complete len:167 (-) Transcript_22360:254-754(-)